MTPNERGTPRERGAHAPGLLQEQPCHALVPARVAAEFCDIPRRDLDGFLESGDVRRVKIKGSWYVDLDSLESFLSRRAKP